MARKFIGMFIPCWSVDYLLYSPKLYFAYVRVFLVSFFSRTWCLGWQPGLPLWLTLSLSARGMRWRLRCCWTDEPRVCKLSTEMSADSSLTRKRWRMHRFIELKCFSSLLWFIGHRSPLRRYMPIFDNYCRFFVIGKTRWFWKNSRTVYAKLITSFYQLMFDQKNTMVLYKN